MKENRNTPLKESTPADTGGTSTEGASLFSMGKGYIKIHRALIDWEWYQDEHLKSVFLHLLLRCNWQDKKWMGRTVKAGTLICSTATLSEELGLSRSSIVRALARLKSSGEISTEADSKWTAITLVNWAKYQGDHIEAEQPADNERTASDTASGQRVTQLADTTKEGKEGNKGRKEERKDGDERKTLFANSRFIDIEVVKASLPELVTEGVNLDHYRDAIRNWSDTKDEKRSDRGWLATFRQWTKTDRDKGELKKIAAARPAWNPRA
jgi:hypothetical protein